MCNLSYPEYIRRREEGRCFHCGGAYTSRHRCPEKNVWVLIMAEDEEAGEAGEEGEMEQKHMELSLFQLGADSNEHNEITTMVEQEEGFDLN